MDSPPVPYTFSVIETQNFRLLMMKYMEFVASGEAEASSRFGILHQNQLTMRLVQRPFGVASGALGDFFDLKQQNICTIYSDGQTMMQVISSPPQNFGMYKKSEIILSIGDMNCNQNTIIDAWNAVAREQATLIQSVVIEKCCGRDLIRHAVERRGLFYTAGGQFTEYGDNEAGSENPLFDTSSSSSETGKAINALCVDIFGPEFEDANPI